MGCFYNDTCGRLCPRFVMTAAVTFADGTLTLNLPDTTTYENCGKYCLVIAQAFPDGVTLAAPVVVTVGDGTTEFPLLTCGGAQVVASQLATRTKYPVRVSTNATGGSVRILRPLPYADVATLAALNDAADAAATEGGGVG